MMLNEGLRLVRVFHDMSAKELAEKLSISVAQLSKIEGGKATPQMNLLEKYALVFETTVPALLMFADNLDDKKNRGKFTVLIRNKMYKLLKALEFLTSEEEKSDNGSKK